MGRVGVTLVRLGKKRSRRELNSHSETDLLFAARNSQ
jgi:hypothetical protein